MCIRFSLYPKGVYGHAGSGSVSSKLLVINFDFIFVLYHQGGYLEYIFKHAAHEVTQ